MNTDDGTLRFGTAIDTSGFDEGVAHIESASANLSSSVEQQTANIAEMLGKVPGVNLDVVINADPINRLETAFQQLDSVINENETEVKNLERRYKELESQIGLARKAGNTDNVASLQKEIDATKILIAERKKVLSVAGEQVSKLTEVENSIKNQTTAVNNNIDAHTSLKQRLRELTLQLVELEASGQRNTDEFRAIQAEAANLADAMGDARAQVSIMANDQRGMQGLISGLQGVTGAFSVAQGAVALFGNENEDLQQIMLKVQSLMAITMGLQQVQATLNKDSAFSLVTLNGLKEWWNKLLAVGTAEQTAEIATTEAETVAQEGDAVATAQNAAAHEALVVSAGQATAAEGATAAATGVETAAAGAGTAANISLAGAFRMVGAAIKSIPVFGWIAAAIGVLIGVVSHFVSKANEMAQSVKEKNEMLKESRKVYANAKVEIKSYQEKIKDFNGTAEQEKKLVQELNNKYGEHLGYCNTLSGWKTKLAQKGEAYCQMLLNEAKAQAILSKATAAYVDYLELVDVWNAKKAGFFQSDAQFETQKKAVLARAKKEYEEWEAKYEAELKKGRQHMEKYDLNSETPSIDEPHTPSKQQSSFDPVEAARKEKEAHNKWRDAVIEYQKNVNDEIQRSKIEYMKEGLEKELAESEANTQAKIDAWRENLRRLAEAEKECLKEEYLAKKGSSLEGWEQSEDGQRSIDDYMQKLLDENPKMARTYQEQLSLIEEEGVNERIAIQQKYKDALIEEFGTIEQKAELITRRWQERINALPSELKGQFAPAMIEQMDEELSELRLDGFKESLRSELEESLKELGMYEFVTRNVSPALDQLDKLSSDTIEKLIETLEKYREKVIETFDPDLIKKYEDAIKNLKDAQSKKEEEQSKNPFDKFIPKYFRERREAQKRLNEQEKLSNELSDKKKQKEEEVKKKVTEIFKMVKDLTGLELDMSEDGLGIDTEQLSKTIEQLNNTGDIANAESLSSSMGQLQNLQGQLGGISEAAGEAQGSYADMLSQFGQQFGGAAGGASGGGAMGGVSAIVHGINDAVQGAKELMDELAETAETFGADTEEGSGWYEAQTFMNGFAEASQGATDAFDSLQSGNPMGLINGVVKSFTGWIKAFNKIHDSKWEKKIKDAEDKIYDLNIAYEKLERQINKSFSAEASKLVEKQTRNLEAQKRLIEEQINAEDSKKNSDEERIKSWEEEVRDLEEKIEDNKEKMIDVIFGEDIKSALDNFADAYASMFDEGISKADTAKNVVNRMIKAMIVEAIKEFSKPDMERLRNMLKDFLIDGVTAYEKAVAQNYIEDMISSIQEQFGWADEYFKEDSAYNQQATNGGFQTMSEDTGSELNGRFTAMQISMEQTRSLADGIKVDTELISENTSYIRSGIEEIQNIQLLQLGELESINKNTKELSEMSQTLERIDKNIQKL